MLIAKRHKVARIEEIAEASRFLGDDLHIMLAEMKTRSIPVKYHKSFVSKYLMNANRAQSTQSRDGSGNSHVGATCT